MNAISVKKAVVVLVTVLALSAGAGVAGWGVEWGNEPTSATQAEPSASTATVASLEERLHGNWTITGIDYRKDATEAWQPVQGGGGYLRFFANGNFSGGTRGSIPGRISMTLFDPFSQRYKATGKQESFTLEILRTQDGAPRLISAFTGQWDQGNLVLTYSWQDRRGVRLTARRATDEEDLDGGWTHTVRNEVTLKPLDERSLVFRNGKFVIIRRKDGTYSESPPAAFTLGDSVHGKTITLKGGEGEVTAGVFGGAAIFGEWPCPLRYRISGDELVLLSYEAADVLKQGELPPFPSSEAEARKRGIRYVRFHRGYTPAKSDEVATKNPTIGRPALPSSGSDQQPPSVRAITEKMRDAALAAYSNSITTACPVPATGSTPECR